MTAEMWGGLADLLMVTALSLTVYRVVKLEKRIEENERR